MSARLVAFALAGALAASVALHLRPAGPSPCALCAPPSAEAMQSCIDCLALTPVQRRALLEECQICCGDGNPFEPRLEVLRAELQVALRQRPIDATAVRAIGRRLAAVRAEAIEAGVEAALRVSALLTPQQLAQVEQMLGSTEYR